MVNSNEKLCSALSYLVLGILWYILDKSVQKSALVKFHVQQALAMIVVGVILGFVGNMIPVLDDIVLFIATVLMIVWIVLGILNGLQARKKELPIIGPFGKNFKL